MARLARVFLDGVPQHVIQRGNNRQVCFTCKEDFVAYLGWLKEYASKNKVAIHAWVLMTNYVHILCTPSSKDGVSRMMQSLGRQYVRYFNYTYQRSGILWEGRHKSCLVQAEDYLLQVYRYIELNQIIGVRVKLNVTMGFSNLFHLTDGAISKSFSGWCSTACYSAWQ